MKHHFSRRQFLQYAGMISGVAVLAACAVPAAPPPPPPAVKPPRQLQQAEPSSGPSSTRCSLM